MARHRGARHAVAHGLMAIVALGAVAGAIVVLSVVAVDSAAGPSPEPAPGPLRILPLGDSITSGSTKTEIPAPGGYRGHLDRILDSAGLDHRFVGTSTGNPPATDDPLAFRHDGWPRARIDELDTALTGWSPLDGGHWLDGVPGRRAVDADVAVVMAGTNDIIQDYDPRGVYLGRYHPHDPDQRARFVKHLVQRLRHLVETLRKHDPATRYVICTIPPMHNPTAAAYNEAIRSGLVPALRADGVDVALADIESALEGQHTIMGQDGVHPTPAGYRMVASAVASAVREVQ